MEAHRREQPERIVFKGSIQRLTRMLILLVTTAIFASLVIESLVRLFNSAYELEWPTPNLAPENALALEVAATLRRAAANMNGK